MQLVFKKRDIILLYILVGLVYILGLFIPLMENDSAQHARTAMRMFLLNDYINLIKYNIPYLDKPHLHFWLSAFSYKVFGISNFAYRLPSLLITFLGAYSTAKLARIFYGDKAMHFASFIFLTAQAIILANHDVRTDAVLTGMSIFSIWQLVRYFKTQSVWAIVLGVLGAVMAFGSKGHLATFVIGVYIIVFVIQFKKWESVFHWKFLLGIILWFLFASPIIYAYYVQYDLNGTLVNGEKVSGVKFILWDQNFQRFEGTNFGSSNSGYFFFFHTILWAFFPWSGLLLFALVSKFKGIRNTFFGETDYTKELMTSVGFTIIFIVISFSKFKLPHYLNSLIPVLAVLISGYIVKLFVKEQGNKINHFLKYFQPTILVMGSIFGIGISMWAFPDLKSGFVFGLLCLAIGLLLWVMYTKSKKHFRWIFYTIYGVIVVNFCLNMHFYPNLLKYQAGVVAAEALKIEKEEQKLDNVFFLKGNRRSWSFEVSLKKIIPELSTTEVLQKVNNKEEVWLFFYETKNNKTQQIPTEFKNFIKRKIDISQYRITKLKIDFINPNTRDNNLKKAYLIKLSST